MFERDCIQRYAPKSQWVKVILTLIIFFSGGTSKSWANVKYAKGQLIVANSSQIGLQTQTIIGKFVTEGDETAYNTIRYGNDFIPTPPTTIKLSLISKETARLTDVDGQESKLKKEVDSQGQSLFEGKMLKPNFEITVLILNGQTGFRSVMKAQHTTQEVSESRITKMVFISKEEYAALLARLYPNGAPAPLKE
mgnify:CR=1 FL=1